MALESYEPSSVLTHTLSSFSMNRGTLINKPVSQVASFKALVCVSPDTPGSVWAIVKATFAGKLTFNTSPWYEITSTSESGTKKFSSHSRRSFGIEIS